MSTTRHLINRQRRLAAVAPVRVRPRPTEKPSETPGAGPAADVDADAGGLNPKVLNP